MQKTDWRAISATLWERSAGSCERCGAGLISPDHAERHHRKLRSQGGGHTVENLLLLCGGCHRGAHARPTYAKHAGAIVPGWAQPANVPFFHALHGLVWLTPDGGTTTLPPESEAS